MRRLLLVGLLAVAGCSGAAATHSEAPETTTAAPTTVVQALDPGVAACRASAKAQKARLAQGDDAPMPTEAQRAKSWDRYQASRYSNLRGVGVALEHAWTEGDLSEQYAASIQLVMVCALHGVEVPTS